MLVVSDRQRGRLNRRGFRLAAGKRVCSNEIEERGASRWAGKHSDPAKPEFLLRVQGGGCQS